MAAAKSKGGFKEAAEAARRDNADVMQFINPPAAQTAEGDHPGGASAPEAGSSQIKYKPNPQYIEVKSRRVQLALQPSLYDRIKKAAEAGGLSVNEYISQTMDKATKEGI